MPVDYWLFVQLILVTNNNLQLRASFDWISSIKLIIHFSLFLNSKAYAVILKTLELIFKIYLVDQMCFLL